MLFRPNGRSWLAAIIVSAAVPVASQVVPAATEGGLPIVVGGGVAGYYTEMVNNYMKGPTAWIDISPIHRPQYLHGLGIELEGRDLKFGSPAGYGGPTNVKLRQYTFGGGAIYTWHHYRNLKLYGKFLVDYGAMDFYAGFPYYTHDYWKVYSVGGGAEYRVWRNVWARGDYEYQFWPIGFGLGGGDLNPQGLTLGVSYDLRHLHRH
ncbi:MAG: outer membrane beta-barrel protein [Terracidiphilus sp.]|jgi:opacity protein-like surface antigen